MKDLKFLLKCGVCYCSAKWKKFSKTRFREYTFSAPMFKNYVQLMNKDEVGF